MLNHDNQCRHYRKQYTMILILICLENYLIRAQTILILTLVSSLIADSDVG